jgi:hypothetical protein
VEKVIAGLSLALLVCSPLQAQDDYSDKTNTSGRSRERRSQPNFEVCQH